MRGEDEEDNGGEQGHGGVQDTLVSNLGKEQGHGGVQDTLVSNLGKEQGHGGVSRFRIPL